MRPKAYTFLRARFCIRSASDDLCGMLNWARCKYNQRRGLMSLNVAVQFDDRRLSSGNRLEVFGAILLADTQFE